MEEQVCYLFVLQLSLWKESRTVNMPDFYGDPWPQGLSCYAPNTQLLQTVQVVWSLNPAGEDQRLNPNPS